MAFTLSTKGPRAEINVTPMIDVLLVLLIIFMVIAPHSIGLRARAPQPAPDNAAPDPGVVVITVNGGGAIHVNEEAVAAGDVTARLTDLVRTRGNVTLFVRADRDITFEPVARLIDVARGVGLDRVALMRP